ncbi:MAG: LapA family protein [Deltaproteobacteria bacterium]|nr:LapA family protein [Deltaproteobacteria bacterium]
MAHVKIILAILLGVLILIVAIQNHEAMSRTVQLRLNPVFAAEQKSGDISLYQMVLVTFLLGVILTGLYGMVERFRLKRQIKTLTRDLQDKDKEISSLRNLPLTYDNVTTNQGDGT